MQDNVAHSSGSTSTQTTAGKQGSHEHGPKHVKEILGRHTTHYLFTQTFLSSRYPNCCFVPQLKGDDAQAVLQMYSYLLLDQACTFSPQLLLF